MVYAFCERRRFAFAIKGASGFDRPLVEDDRKRARRLRNRRKIGGSPVQIIGVDQGKVIIHSRLRIVQPGPGYIHFPRDEVDDEYFAQLAAEKLVVKHRMGRAQQEWAQQRPRNEALDCAVYALAALRLWGGLDQAAARQQRGGTTTPQKSPIAQFTDQLNQRRRAQLKLPGGFVNSWK